MHDPRIERLAKVLVGYSTAVKPDQLVRISGSPLSLPLVSAIYREVLAAGAHPMVRLTYEELEELFVKHANTKQLEFVNPITLFEVGKIDAALPLDYRTQIRQIAGDIDRVLAGFVRGQVSVCMILGTYYAVAL
ncbi:MAG TPA: aminopeptidase, partial [Tepidisphaeraceae bacterium]|nr:aminopeptidase [Tepidisphaeraceae bacterium]